MKLKLNQEKKILRPNVQNQNYYKVIIDPQPLFYILWWNLKVFYIIKTSVHCLLWIVYSEK